MKDLEIAKKRLKENSLSLCIVKRGKILFESNSEGIHDLVQAIDELYSLLNKASVADSTVGKAVALLFIHSKFSSIFATTMSEEALKVLKTNNIFIEFENLVPNIMNKNKTDICPFERMVLNCNDAGQAFNMFKSFLERKLNYKSTNFYHA